MTNSALLGKMDAMDKIRHSKTTQVLGAPEGWNEASPDLPCDALPVVRTRDQGVSVIHSYWKPSMLELWYLLHGATIDLGIVGHGMPPVIVGIDIEAVVMSTLDSNDPPVMVGFALERQAAALEEQATKLTQEGNHHDAEPLSQNAELLRDGWARMMVTETALAVFKQAYEAACGFIDTTPADPDTSRGQRVAYAKFLEAQAQVIQMLKEMS